MGKANPKASTLNVLQIEESGACCECGPCKDLVTSAAWIVDTDANTLTITDASTYPNGDSADKTYFYLTQGTTELTPIDVSPAVFDLSAINKNKEVIVKMKIVSTNGCIDVIQENICCGILNINNTEGVFGETVEVVIPVAKDVVLKLTTVNAGNFSLPQPNTVQHVIGMGTPNDEVNGAAYSEDAIDFTKGGAFEVVIVDFTPNPLEDYKVLIGLLPISKVSDFTANINGYDLIENNAVFIDNDGSTFATDTMALMTPIAGADSGDKYNFEIDAIGNVILLHNGSQVHGYTAPITEDVVLGIVIMCENPALTMEIGNVKIIQNA